MQETRGDGCVIPALDMASIDDMERLVKAVDKENGIYGYKVGFVLGLTYGLPLVVETIRRHSRKPVIYDHQKAATDIPDTGRHFAEVMTSAGVDEVILFPQAGPATLKAWTEALHQHGRKVIVGAAMTHPQYLTSEGGYLADERILSAYETAAHNGVRAFVLPLTKPAVIAQVLARLRDVPETEFYSPGFGAQGGDPLAFAGQNFRVIVGRSLVAATDPAAYVRDVQRRLLQEVKP